ncbi:choice-of-anchor Q domain-containing protein [Mangrovivirga cuniculi]|nr:choice-of-anchor Q domain-containing protein [Mangrovivirga cuniculi]
MKNNFLFLLSLLTFSLLFSSCIKEDAPFEPINEPLVFSQDTIFFDTLLTNVESPAVRYKVVNPTGNNILIPSIRLQKGDNSPYSLYVKGNKGKAFSNVEVLGGDSLEILVNAFYTKKENSDPVPVYDEIIIESLYANSVIIEGYSQDVTLIQDFIFRNDTTLTSGSRIFLNDNAYIDSLVTVTVEEDVKFFMGNNARLLIKGSLQAIGSAEQKIHFTQSRQDGIYENVPGQWDGIYLLENSMESILDHVIIKNASFGLRLGDPDITALDLTVKNTEILNSLSHGILSFTTDFNLENVVISEAGEQGITALAGGTISIIHTSVNTGSGVLSTSSPVTGFSDYLELSSGEILSRALELEIRNSIVWSPFNSSIVIQELMPESNNIVLSSSVFGSIDIDEKYFSGENLFETDPLFIDAGDFNLSLDSESPAIDFGITLGIGTDILDNPRDENPDAGAYEFIN